MVPSYGYFIRGAQTTFSGVLRFVEEKISRCMDRFYWQIIVVIVTIYKIFCIPFQRPTVEVHPVQNDRF